MSDHVSGSYHVVAIRIGKCSFPTPASLSTENHEMVERSMQNPFNVFTIGNGLQLNGARIYESQ